MRHSTWEEEGWGTGWNGHQTAAQARIISDLNETIRDLRSRTERAEADADRYRAGYDFYMLIQKACQASPVVAGEFARFLMTCKLVEEDGEGTPGLTAPDNQLGLKL